MKALFYYSLRRPHVWQRLNDDILAAEIETRRPVPYAKARAVPYLEAVARETLRFHPAVSMAMERVVPEEGLTLPDGRFVPAGSYIAMNPYILGRNKDVYGSDADEFKPERWLQTENETDDKYQLRMRSWNAADLTFGAGSRICLGRNLSLMELYKVVATTISRYEIELIDKTETWRTSARWFYRVDGGLTCRIRRRKG
jgi:cytochrome P450